MNLIKNLLLDGGKVMHAQIYLDNTSLVAARGYNWNAGTNIVVTYCGEGQSVWVKCTHDQCNMYDNLDTGCSTFSGTLLSLV